jgi:hypothetical protein
MVGEMLLAVGDPTSGARRRRPAAPEPAALEVHIRLARLSQRRGDVAGAQDAIPRARAIDPANPLLAGR